MGEAKQRILDLEKYAIALGRQFAALLRSVDSVERGGQGTRFCFGTFPGGFQILVTKDADFMAEVEGMATATIGPAGATGYSRLMPNGDFEPLLPTDTTPDPPQ